MTEQVRSREGVLIVQSQPVQLDMFVEDFKRLYRACRKGDLEGLRRSLTALVETAQLRSDLETASLECGATERAELVVKDLMDKP